MNDLKQFLDAVTEMRTAQKLEMDALPANFKVWKKTRQQMTVAQIEAKVDALLEELRRAYADDAHDTKARGSKTKP